VKFNVATTSHAAAYARAQAGHTVTMWEVAEVAISQWLAAAATQ